MPARRRLSRLLLLALLVCGVAGFSALGVWQLKRLHWKRALIARVEGYLHAPPTPAPPPALWPTLDSEREEYRRVVVHGQYVQGAETRTQAVTELGAGYWVLSPLRTAQGWVVLINRGFVPANTQAAPPPAGPVTVPGLLRRSEPGGGFLRTNQPAQERWYSRDVAAIARARRLQNVAPYFIDAAANPAATGWPRPGMTVIRFRNQHLQYALTWFALALLSAWGMWRVLSDGRRMRHHGPDADFPPPPDRHA